MGDGLKRALVAARLTRMDVKPEVGQIWRDNDSRLVQLGVRRFVRIYGIAGMYAHCEVRVGDRDWLKRKTRIRLDRFRPNSTGYELVSEVAK